MNSLTGLEIAIVGMVGRFPKAKNLEQFWQNLRDGVECISHFTDDELRAAGIDEQTLNNPHYVKARAILEDAEWFDAGFFGLSPREAEILDPQQRVFLECAWEALETAGYNPDSVDAIGVFGGATLSGYLMNLYHDQQLMNTLGQFPLLLGNGREFLTTRVSYLLNLRGPSINVQTACSTSLVAVHLACQSLLSGECDMALAGGVSIRLPLKGGYLYQEGGISSPDGHCRAFDASAQGTVGGSGAGIVVLKRLEDALNDRDTIYTIIKGSALNNDGAVKVSFTAPRIEGQAAVIQAAQAMAEVEPHHISYIEAHGTGTALGDPIEIAALTQSFQQQTQETNFCAIGAVKTNIGHLDAAAGIAGLIKTTLALQHRLIPPSLHFQRPNPQIDFANSPFYVCTQPTPWQSPHPRRAGVSSFGIGGTNAHVILEEAPELPSGSASRPWQLLLLSAKTETALSAATQRWITHAQSQPDLNLADVAYTLQVGRKPFSHRRFTVCQTLAQGIEAFTTNSQQVLSQLAPDRSPSVVFLFPGQGSQYLLMGQTLYQTEPTFRDTIDLCAELLQPHLDVDLRQILYPASEQKTIAQLQLNQTAIAQSALFSVEYALAKLWMSWGIIPQALIGHSIGEYVAACVSEVFSLEDALRLVALRGKLMQQQPSGAMLSVACAAEAIAPYLNDALCLAADNAPNLCVVAGTEFAIATLEAQLTTQQISCRRLHTSHAFHSPMMAEVMAPLQQQLEQIQRQAPQIPWISNLTGNWITTSEAIDPHYWANHLRQPVRFRQGMQTLLQQPDRLLLEVGPGRTLTTLARQQPAFTSNHAVAIHCLPHPQDPRSDAATLLTALGQLWLNQVSIDWSGFYANEQRRRIPLPTYPFERQRYWIEPKMDSTLPATQLHKQPVITDWFYVPSWKRSPLRQVVQPDSNPSETWLLFIHPNNSGNEIAQRLQAANQSVITIQIGDRFQQLNDTTYCLNPQQPDDYNKLLQALSDRPTRILHSWSLTSTTEIADFDSRQTYGCYSLLFLVQALAHQQWTDPIDITLLTSQVFAVTGDENLCPDKATILGPAKVIPQEYRHLSCRTIELELSNHKAVSTQLIDALLAELLTPISDRVIAYRHQQRWIQTYEAMPLPAAELQSVNLRHQGVYFITGGLGNIGLTFAAFLTKQYQAKLVLVSRSPLPDRSHWSTGLATHDDTDTTSRRIQQIQALEQAGAEVLLITADVADEIELRHAIDQAKAHFGTIHGVIHAAGQVGEQAFRLVSETSLTDCQQQFQAKIEGVQILDRVLQNQSLDFCLLCSSLASVLGGLGFSAYAAANAFMDTFVQQKNDATPWISVNWDGWQFRSSANEEAAIGSSLAQLALKPEEGIAVLQRLLSYRVGSQVIVSTGNLQTRIEQWLKLQPAHSLESSNLSQAKTYARPDLAQSYQSPNTPLEHTIAKVWQTFLGIDRIGIHDNFFELGGHSLMATQMVAQIRQQFQVELPLRSLFENPTIAGLTHAIVQNQDQPAESAIPVLARDTDRLEHLLTTLDQLSDAEVDALLHEFLSPQN
jgi:phthiocerol/phenolphthiocerol synthesis type-I polyketide synthase E